MRMRIMTLVILGLAIAPSAVSAEQAPPSAEQSSEEGQDIVVIGLKNPFTLTAKQLNDMLKAWSENRGRYAPNAHLYVDLTDLGDGVPSDAHLLLNSPDQAITLPSDGKGRIHFPDQLVGRGPWSLTSNIAKSRVGIALWVMSPGTSAKQRTMGDLRLQCAVMWAAAKSTVSPVLRGLFSAAGACHSSRIAFYFRSAQPLHQGKVEYAGKSVPISIGKNHLAYRAPVWDKHIPDDAQVKLDFD